MSFWFKQFYRILSFKQRTKQATVETKIDLRHDQSTRIEENTREASCLRFKRKSRRFQSCGYIRLKAEIREKGGKPVARVRFLPLLFKNRITAMCRGLKFLIIMRDHPSHIDVWRNFGLYSSRERRFIPKPTAGFLVSPSGHLYCRKKTFEHLDWCNVALGGSRLEIIGLKSIDLIAEKHQSCLILEN